MCGLPAEDDLGGGNTRVSGHDASALLRSTSVHSGELIIPRVKAIQANPCAAVAPGAPRASDLATVARSSTGVSVTLDGTSQRMSEGCGDASGTAGAAIVGTLVSENSGAATADGSGGESERGLGRAAVGRKKESRSMPCLVPPLGTRVFWMVGAWLLEQEMEMELETEM
eukprot:gene8515-10112_t